MMGDPPSKCPEVPLQVLLVAKIVLVGDLTPEVLLAEIRQGLLSRCNRPSSLAADWSLAKQPRAHQFPRLFYISSDPSVWRGYRPARIHQCCAAKFAPSAVEIGARLTSTARKWLIPY